MQRTINRKAALIVLALIVLVAGGLFFLHRYQADRQVSIFLQKAEEAIAANNESEALAHLERYLQARPTDAEVLKRHALLLETTARTAPERVRAYRALENVLRVSLDAGPEVRRRAAGRAMALGWHREAKEHLQALLVKEPANLEWKQQLALCLEHTEERPLAEKLYREIIQQSKSQVSSFVALARLLEQGKKADEADRLLKDMVAANPDSAEAHLDRGQFLRRSGRLDEAARELETARPLAKDERTAAGILLAEAEVAIARRKPEQAAVVFQKGIEQFPKNVRFYLGKAQLDLLGGPDGRATALTLLQRALPLATEGPNEQVHLAKLLLDAGDPKSARALCETVKTRMGNNPVLDYLQARLCYEEGKLGEGIAIQERVRSELVKFPLVAVESDLHLAAAYEQLGNQDGQLAALERVLRVSPASPEVLLSKAEVLSSVGKTAEAIDIYRRLQATKPGAGLGLARLLITLERQKPEEDRAWTEVQQLLDQCTAEEKRSRDYVLTRLQLLWSSGNLDELERAATAACRENPKEATYWLAKVAVLERRLAQDEKGRELALRTCLDEAGQALGDVAELRLARARSLRGVPADQAVPRLAELTQDIEKFKPRDRAALFITLAGHYRLIGKNDEASRLLRSAAELGLHGLPAQIKLAEAAVEEKRDADVQRHVEAIRKAEGEEGVTWRMIRVDQFLIQTPVEQNSLIEARKLLHEVTVRRPNWYRVHTAQGRILELEGRPDLGLEKYVRAVETGERNPEVIKKTVQGLLDRRRLEQLRRLMAGSLSDLIDSSMYARLASVVSLATRDTPAQALALAEGAVREDSPDYSDHLWLGNFRWVAGNRKGAESAFRRAVSLAKAEPQAWAALLVYLVLSERQEDAVKEVTAAADALKDKLPHALIPYYEALNQRDQAEAQYVKLLGKQPNDPALLESLAGFYLRGSQSEKAEPSLKVLLQSGDAARAAWARRVYALILSKAGGGESHKRAMALLEENLKGGAQNPEDLRARALVQATRPGSRRGVIADLERAFALVRPSPNEAVVLAQLYEDNGQWNKAAALLHDVASYREGEAPLVLAYSIRAFLRHGQVNQAATLLERLEKAAPNGPATVEAKARVRSAQGQTVEAATLLETSTARWATAKKDPEVYLTTSQILEELGALEAAERQVKLYVAAVGQSRPAAVLVEVGFRARRGRTAEAIKLCETHWDRLPLEDAAPALVSVVGTTSLSAEEIKKVEQRLVAAYRAAPNKVEVSLALADFYQFTARPAEAEAVYRKMLEREPDNPVAMNNLAWLLSERPEMLDQAIAWINKAIEHVGPEGSLLDTRGMILLRRKQYPEAISDLSQAVADLPRPTRYLHLALAYHQAGNTTEAKNVWNQAKKLGLDGAKLPATERQWFSELAKAYNR